MPLKVAMNDPPVDKTKYCRNGRAIYESPTLIRDALTLYVNVSTAEEIETLAGPDLST